MSRPGYRTQVLHIVSKVGSNTTAEGDNLRVGVTVVVEAVTPKHEQALEYLAVPEQAEAYAGTAVGVAVLVIVIVPSTVTVRAKKLEQSARAEDCTARPRLVPVTALAQLSESHLLACLAKTARLEPARARTAAIDSLMTFSWWSEVMI